MQSKPDINAVTETWFEPSKINTIILPGYNFLHSDASTASADGSGLAGGVGI